MFTSSVPGASGTAQSAIGGQYAYAPAAPLLSSISAMPVYRYKSHEELRWEDYQLKNKGGAGADTSNTFSPSHTSVNQSSSLFPSNPFTQQFGLVDRHGESVDAFSCPFNPFARQYGFGDVHKVEPVNVSSSSFPSTPWCCCRPATFGSRHGGSNLAPYTATREVESGNYTPKEEEPLSISKHAFGDKSHEELRWEHYHRQGKGAAGIDTSKTFSSSLTSAELFSSLFPSNPFTRQSDFLDRHGKEFVNAFPSFPPSNPFARQPGFGNLHKGESASVFSSPFPSNPFTRQPGFGDLHKGESANVFCSPFPSNPFPLQPCFRDLHKRESVDVFSSPFHSNPYARQSGFGNLYKGESVNVFSSPSPSNPYAQQPGFGDLHKGESVNVFSSPFPSNPFAQQPGFSDLHKGESVNGYRPSTFGGQHGGSKLTPDNTVPKIVGGISAQNEPLSISAMPAYKDKSHEELRLEYNRIQRKDENTTDKGSVRSAKFSKEPNKEQNYDSNQKRDSHVSTPKEEGSDVLVLLPKLGLFSGYYTEPGIFEFEAKERADPGFCSHVKDFLVGKHGYGSIKFLGETDVRNLDIEAHIRFNDHEVIVLTDESEKPKIGEGLNKAAEISLLNLKCIDPKTGKQYVDGPKVEKYRKLLMKAAAERGGEFVSYDPVGGEWKLRVPHF